MCLDIKKQNKKTDTAETSPFLLCLSLSLIRRIICMDFRSNLSTQHVQTKPGPADYSNPTRTASNQKNNSRSASPCCQLCYPLLVAHGCCFIRGRSWLTDCLCHQHLSGSLWGWGRGQPALRQGQIQPWHRAGRQAQGRHCQECPWNCPNASKKERKGFSCVLCARTAGWFEMGQWSRYSITDSIMAGNSAHLLLCIWLLCSALYLDF